MAQPTLDDFILQKKQTHDDLFALFRYDVSRRFIYDLKADFPNHTIKYFQFLQQNQNFLTLNNLDVIWKYLITHFPRASCYHWLSEYCPAFFHQMINGFMKEDSFSNKFYYTFSACSPRNLHRHQEMIVVEWLYLMTSPRLQKNQDFILELTHLGELHNRHKIVRLLNRRFLGEIDNRAMMQVPNPFNPPVFDLGNGFMLDL